MSDRHRRDLDWAGCWNARDLGGLATTGAARTRWGALVRSENLERLTGTGWAQLVAHGVRTVVDLRSADPDQTPTAAPEGVDVDVVHLAIEAGLAADPTYVAWVEAGVLATPLYYAGFVERWPARCVAALEAVASARPGGVLVHCQKGRDRTGLVVLLLLAVAGVEGADIADDYTRSWSRVATARARRLGAVDTNSRIATVLERHGRTAPEALAEACRRLDGDLGDTLAGAGLDASLRARLRERLVVRDAAGA